MGLTRAAATWSTASVHRHRTANARGQCTAADVKTVASMYVAFVVTTMKILNTDIV